MKIQKYPIHIDDGFFHGWPDVALLGDGRSLLAVYNECLEHCDRRHTQVMSLRSNDFGRTWSAPIPLTPPSDNSGWYYNCPRIQRLDDATILFIIDRIPLKPGNTLYEGAEAICNAEVLMARSTDDGATWSALEKLPLHGIVPSKILVTHTGRWIIGAHHPMQNGDNAQFAIHSNDAGKTWSAEKLIASVAGYSLCEASFVETPDGKIVCLLRENGFNGRDCMKVISEDNGETWSDVIALPILACHRPVGGRLNDGRYLITYRFYQGGKYGQQNFFGALTDAESLAANSRDGAGVRIFPIDWDGSEHSDLGYSGWVQNANGEIFVITYIHDDSPKAQLRGYSIVL